MSSTRLTAEMLLPELEFVSSRSSGPGGQNVNKVNTRITLRFNIRESRILADDEKETLLYKLASKLTLDGWLQVNAQEKRSQLQNKELAIEKFNHILSKAFEVRKARRKTKPSKTAVRKRLDSKKKRSEKKQWRKGLD
jgi:ribosome-associated protein